MTERSLSSRQMNVVENALWARRLEIGSGWHNVSIKRERTNEVIDPHDLRRTAIERHEDEIVGLKRTRQPLAIW